MEFKGTKGKWICTTSQFKDYVKVNCNNYIDKQEPILYTVNAENSDEVWNEIKANALLISKAPEMLEMLIKINNIENPAFGLKTFDVNRLKKELQQLIEEAEILLNAKIV